ncbi:hypothetical protein [Agromyces allii]|uniref:Uncharacterized protein n=1 Tax=Agromyces allii TaxID=393607 RepID=A0ABN2RFM8_9MICO|nr:hypothetical protein [Agromyces allii]
MTGWTLLTDAYGPADEIPELLAAASSNDPAAWEELWGRLCHQGTVSSASYAAVPILAELVLRSKPVGYNQALALAAAIIGSEDGPEKSETIRHRYAADVGEMRRFAEQNLGHARSDVEFVYGLQTVLSFDGVSVWKNHLESIADGEVGLECPNCEQFILVALDGTTQYQSEANESIMHSPPAPADPDRLAPAAAHMYSLALTHERADVAESMLRLFGAVTCPACGHRYDIASALNE